MRIAARFGTNRCRIALVAAALLASGSALGGGGFHPVQLHLHGSLSEGVGRMVDQAARNRELGVEALWWTDHEGMYSIPPEYAFALAFDFEAGTLILTEPPLPERGFFDDPGGDFVRATLIDSAAAQGSRSLALSAERSAPSDSSVYPLFDGYRFHTGTARLEMRSFFQEIELDLALRPGAPAPADHHFAVRCLLSYSGEGMVPHLLTFVAGRDSLPADDGLHFYRPMESPPLGSWTSITLPIGQVGRSLVPYGEDLHLHEISLGWLAFGPVDDAAMLVDDFHLRIGGPESGALLARQAQFLDSLPEPAPVHFVGLELSRGHDGAKPHHINIYAPSGPPAMPDWSDPRYDPLDFPRCAVRWAQSLGYAVSHNHIFGPSTGWIDELSRDRLRQQTLDELAYGADFLEVGYPLRGRGIEEHFAVWDDLLRRDSFQTGLGVSDSHNAVPWIFTPNRWVSFVRTELLAQQEILLALARGRICLGDPYLVGGDAFLICADASGRFAMGDVVVSDLNEVDIVYRGATDLPSIDLDLLTVHPARVDTLRLGHPGALIDGQATLSVSDTCHLRLEARDAISGELVLASNPIHFRRVAPPRSRPGMRIRKIIEIDP